MPIGSIRWFTWLCDCGSCCEACGHYPDCISGKGVPDE